MQLWRCIYASPGHRCGTDLPVWRSQGKLHSTVFYPWRRKRKIVLFGQIHRECTVQAGSYHRLRLRSMKRTLAGFWRLKHSWTSRSGRKWDWNSKLWSKDRSFYANPVFGFHWGNQFVSPKEICHQCRIQSGWLTGMLGETGGRMPRRRNKRGNAEHIFSRWNKRVFSLMGREK